MKHIDIEHFTQYTIPHGLCASSLGEVLFATKRACLEQNSYKKTLWLMRKNTLTELCDAEDLQCYCWQDERHVLLASAMPKDSEEKPQNRIPTTHILQMPVQNTAAPVKTLLHLHHEIEKMQCLSDGSLLLLLRWDGAVEDALTRAQGDTKKAEQIFSQDENCEVMCTLPFWENGGGLYGQKRRRLFLYKDGVLSPLTDKNSEVEYFYVGQSDTVYCILRDFKRRLSPYNRLLVLSIHGDAPQDISLGDTFRHDAVVPFAEGKIVVCGCDMRRAGLNQNPVFYTLHPPNYTPTVLEDSGAHSLYCSVLTDLAPTAECPPFAQHNDACWVSTIGQDAHLVRLDTDAGGITHISKEQGAIYEAVPLPNGFCTVAMRQSAGPELYFVSQSGEERPISALNSPLKGEYSFATPLPFSVKVSPSQSIHGFVMLPTHITENIRLPVILYIHGGPKCTLGSVLSHEMQYLCACGYAIVFCNPPGSDGKGDNFADIRGHYGGVDCDGILAFLDAALAHYPLLNGDRVGIIGGSYGGFMVNLLICRTHRFRAAVSERGISNWISMFTLSDIGERFVADQIGATPWENCEKLWEQSPLRHAQNAKTPTLFLHGEEDYRCPAEQGLQMYSALAHFGVDTKLCLFRGEGHGLSGGGKPQNRLRRLREIGEWFERYV